jgi:hypothetical protein
MGRGKKPFTPVHAAQEPESGLYLNLETDEPRLAPFADASHYATHLDACTRLAEIRAPLPVYEVVRVDRP